MADPGTDRIEKSIVIKAPRARVWRALTDPVEFGAWFGVKLPPGARFAPGATIRGPVTYEGYEHLTFEADVEDAQPERMLAMRWHPGAVAPARPDIAREPKTRVVFTLEDVPEGTLLKVVETGFDALPEARRQAAFRDNDQGWAEQVRNIARHVAANR